MFPFQMKNIFSILTVSLSLAGCSVLAVADAVVTTGATVVSTGAKAVGAAVDAVIPDSKPKN
ncbi:MAG: hypothetical protein ACKVOY_15415 [Burkholderiaceae bacterium]